MISDLERLKKMMLEKPWLYEETEHRVLHLADSAIRFIQRLSVTAPSDDMDGNPAAAIEWLKDNEG